MKVNRDTIEIRTEEGQFLDITKSVQEVVSRSGVRNGLLLINSLHTTIALFINESQSALLGDVASTLQRLIPRRAGISTTIRPTPTAIGRTPTRTCARRCWDGRSRWESPTERSSWASTRA